MKYRNKKTGFVFESDAKCEGADYEVVVEKEQTAEKKAPQKTNKKREK